MAAYGRTIDDDMIQHHLNEWMRIANCGWVTRLFFHCLLTFLFLFIAAHLRVAIRFGQMLPQIINIMTAYPMANGHPDNDLMFTRFDTIISRSSIYGIRNKKKKKIDRIVCLMSRVTIQLPQFRQFRWATKTGRKNSETLKWTRRLRANK